MNCSNKKFLKCFVIVAVVVLCIQILAEDIPFLKKMISTTQATYSEFDYVIENKKATINGYKGENKEVIIPDEVDGVKVDSIGEGTFSEVGKISKVVIPSTVTTIEAEAFKLCTNLEEIELSNNLTKIEENAFLGCTNLKSIKLSEKIETIGAYAFSGSGIEEITIPNTVDSIGAYAFSNCYSLQNIVLLGGVTKLEDNTFQNCGIKKMVIPSSVLTIGNMVFSGCTEMTSIEIPESVTNIGQYAFEKCTSLKKIEIPNSVDEIGAYAFEGCKDLIDVVLSNNMNVVNDSLFQNCESLSSITLSDKTNIIGADSFGGCVSLEEITLGNQLKIVCDRAFLGCAKLKSVELGDGIEVIGINSFRNCEKLEKVQLGEKVVSIGEGAFYFCRELKDINLKSKVLEKVGTDAFNEIGIDAVLTVPVGTIDTYKKLINYDDNLKEGTIIIEQGKDILDNDIPQGDKPEAEEDTDKAPTDKPEAEEDTDKAPTNEPKAEEDIDKAPTDKPKVEEDTDKAPTDKSEAEKVDADKSSTNKAETEKKDADKTSTNKPQQTTVVAKTPEPTKMAQTQTVKPQSTKTEEPVVKTAIPTSAPVEQKKQVKFVYMDGNGKVTNSVSTDKGKNIKLPESKDLKNNKFIGWIDITTDENKLYAAGTEYMADTDKKFKALYANFNMLEGASVKLNSSTGIRFYTRVAKETYDNIDKYATEYMYGTLICNSNNINSEDDFIIEKLQKSSTTHLDIPVHNWYKETDTYKEYTGVVINVAKKNYNLELIARAYIKIKYADGKEKYIYSDYLKDNKRSIAQVAKMALADKDVYTSVQRKILEQFTKPFSKD